MDVLSNIGNWCSIIGLMISIGTIIFTSIINNKIKKLETKILFNARIRAGSRLIIPGITSTATGI